MSTPPTAVPTLQAYFAFLPRLLRRFWPAEAPQWIEPNELSLQLQRAPGGVTVIDVRRPDEFRGKLGHIPHAVNLPLDDLSHRLGEFSASEAKPIVLVCHTDKRSSKAAALMRDAGFADVHVLRGGMLRWNQSK